MTENEFRSHFSPFQSNTQLWFFFLTKWLPAAILVDQKSLSIAFLAISDSIHNFFSSQNGCRRPFWMTENHFRSHFSPFQINTQLFFLSQNGCRRPFWMTENHFQSHFSPFQINTQLFFSQNGCRRLFWVTKNHFRLHFSSFQINTQLFFSQNGFRWAFWMTENQFWSHLSPFQINSQLFFFFHKMAAGGHFGWPIAFLAISDQYATFFFHTKWLPAAILDDRKCTFNRISRHFRSIRNFFFHKMAAGGYFGWPKITFDCISRHFRSIHNFFFHKMASGGHFGWPKISFDRIYRLFRSIRNSFFFLHKMAAGGHFGWPIAFLAISDQYATFFFHTKWLPAAILDDRKSLLSRISRHFRSLHNFYFFDFVHKMSASGHFGWTKITFDRISRHFRSIRNLIFLNSQNGCCRRPFWMTESTFEYISHHFRSIRNFFVQKWLPAAILEVRFGPFQIGFFQLWIKWLPAFGSENRSSITLPFQINTTTFFFFKFTKLLPAAILFFPKALSNDKINRQFFKMADQWRPFWKLWPICGQKPIGFFPLCNIIGLMSFGVTNMKLIGEFVTQLEMPQAFCEFLYKMAARGHFVFSIDDKNHRVLVIWDCLNGYGEYEFDRCICDKVMACKSVGVRRRRRRP